MNCKDYLKQGSIFLETMLALAVLALILSAVFALQLSVFQRVVTNTYRFSRFVAMGSVFQEALQDRVFEKKIMHYEKKIEDPEQIIILDREPVNAKSSLARFKKLYIQKALGQWNDTKGNHQEVVVDFVFIPEKKKRDELEEQHNKQLPKGLQ